MYRKICSSIALAIFLAFGSLSLAHAEGNKVIVTEKIPWATCNLAPGGSEDIENRRYECDVPEGFA